MSNTGLSTFDTAVQDANAWLRKIHMLMADAPADADIQETDRRRAYVALRGVLMTLRDRIPVTLAAHLATQLPLLVRGVFFENFQPENQPETYRAQGEFFTRVEGTVKDVPLDGERATAAVLEVLSEYVTPGLNDKVRAALPEDVRDLWPLMSEKDYSGDGA